MVGDAREVLNEIADAAREELQKRVEAATGHEAEENRLRVIQRALEVYVHERVEQRDWREVAGAALALIDTKEQVDLIDRIRRSATSC